MVPISTLERVQRRATKLVALIKDLSYSDRLQNLGLPTLEYRRIHYDMIQIYKLIHGIDYINNMENLSYRLKKIVEHRTYL